MDDFFVFYCWKNHPSWKQILVTKLWFCKKNIYITLINKLKKMLIRLFIGSLILWSDLKALRYTFLFKKESSNLDALNKRILNEVCSKRYKPYPGRSRIDSYSYLPQFHFMHIIPIHKYCNLTNIITIHKYFSKYSWISYLILIICTEFA